MKFYSAWFCPFAQRAWITLLLKAIDFEYVEVDPYRKSDWWRAVSRGTSKVPVLEVPGNEGSAETTIIDSTRIVEYLDDLVPGIYPLLRGSPEQRAEQRHWMDHVNRAIVPYFYRFLQATEENDYRNESRQRLLAGLHDIATEMSESGPCFHGPTPSAVDVLLAPFAYRIEVLLGHYRDFAVPRSGAPWSRYRDWYTAMLDNPVFKSTSTDRVDYRSRLIEFYHPYSLGEGQKDVTAID